MTAGDAGQRLEADPGIPAVGQGGNEPTWIFASADVETLRDRLFENLLEQRHRSDDPFLTETVVVGSPGMKDWLRAEMASHLGACVNVRFQFSSRALYEALGGDPDSLWTVPVMAFALLGLLQRSSDNPELRHIIERLSSVQKWTDAERQLATLGDGAWQWAAQTAELLDKLALYRAGSLEYMLAGSAGRRTSVGAAPKLPPWLGEAWRFCEEILGPRHLYHAVARGSCRNLPLPLHVFGLATLEPLHFEAVRLLALRGSAYLYLLSPAAPVAASEEACHGQLARSWGGLSRSFLQELNSHGVAWLEGKVDDRRDCLAVLRGSIRGQADNRREDWSPRRNDNSVQFHGCHGPLRQVEVLRDVLLEMFAGDDTLEPRQVVIMTPQLELYAPLVQAVFSGGGKRESKRPAIPVRVVDTQAGPANPFGMVVSNVLKLAAGRLKASAVFDLLSYAPVRRRFGFLAAEVESAGRLLVESGLRWGLDESDRVAHGLPGSEQNTAEFALARLAVGAVAGVGDEILDVDGQQLAPVAGLAGERLVLGGKVARLLRTLSYWLREFRRATTVPRWCRRLLAVLDDLCQLDSEDRLETFAFDRVCRRVAELETGAHRAGFTGEVNLSALQLMLGQDITRTGMGGFSGEVLLCSFRPMRAVPFRVACLLGMDDGFFPRSGRMRHGEWFAAGSGNRTTAWRIPDERLEDLQVLAEVVLCAGSNLVVTYTARDPHKNERRHPAGPVEQLLEVLLQPIVDPDRRRQARETLVRQHPLQPFSHKYFDGSSAVFSYDRRAVEIARQLQNDRVEPAGPLAEGESLPVPVEFGQEPLRVTIDELITCLRHPARHLLRRRLGVHLDDYQLELKDREPVEPATLEKWQLSRRILEGLLSSREKEDLRKLLRAEGALPLGQAGEDWFDEKAGELQNIMERARAESRDMAEQSLDVKLAFSAVEGFGEPAVDVVLEGTFTAFVSPREDGYLITRLVHDNPRAERYLLDAWVRMLSVACQEKKVVESVIWGREKQPVKLRLDRPGAEAEKTLRTLLELYLQALHRRLPLPEKAGHKLAAGRDPHDVYFAPPYSSGDEDEYWKVMFPEVLPIEHDDFARLAGILWRPLLDAQVKKGSRGSGKE